MRGSKTPLNPPVNGGREEHPVTEYPVNGGREEHPVTEYPANGGREEYSVTEYPANGGREEYSVTEYLVTWHSVSCYRPFTKFSNNLNEM